MLDMESFGGKKASCTMYQESGRDRRVVTVLPKALQESAKVSYVSLKHVEVSARSAEVP